MYIRRTRIPWMIITKPAKKPTDQEDRSVNFAPPLPSSSTTTTMQASSTSHPRAPSCVMCGFLAPCRRALARLFRIPAQLSVRAFRFRTLRRAASNITPRHRRRRRHRRRTTFRSVRAVFWPLVPPPPATTLTDHGEIAGATARRVEASPPEEVVVAQAPVPSPETPAYLRMVARLRSSGRSGGGEGEEAEEEGACRSFESRLMEMLLEEGKVRDLKDVEELLRCWERLKSPVFVDLVCRFYGELCKDLFFPDEEDDDAGGGGELGTSSSSTAGALSS